MDSVNKIQHLHNLWAHLCNIDLYTIYSVLAKQTADNKSNEAVGLIFVTGSSGIFLYPPFFFGGASLFDRDSRERQKGRGDSDDDMPQRCLAGVETR